MTGNGSLESVCSSSSFSTRQLPLKTVNCVRSIGTTGPGSPTRPGDAATGLGEIGIPGPATGGLPGGPVGATLWGGVDRKGNAPMARHSNTITVNAVRRAIGFCHQARTTFAGNLNSDEASPERFSVFNHERRSALSWVWPRTGALPAVVDCD